MQHARARHRLDPIVGDDLRTPYAEHFDGLGTFLQAVAQAGVDGAHHADQRLDFVRSSFVATSLGSNETTPSEGAFLIPPEQTAALFERSYQSGAVLSRCTQWPVTRSTMRVPHIDELARADGSRHGGIAMSFCAPGAQIAASKPRFRISELNRRALKGALVLSNELLADAPQLEQIFSLIFGLEAAFVVEREIVKGTGAAGPLGIVNSSALLTAPVETGQAADTLVAANFSSMMRRLWGPSRSSAVWLVGPDVMAQAEMLSLPTGSALVQYDVDGAPRILGRPVLISESTSALGDAGDLILCDLSQYALSEPTALTLAFSSQQSGLFESDEGTFRFSCRVDGAPLWHAPVTPANSSITQSPFVTLAAR
jgi:HK97 family phage major capsid protein